MYISPGETPAEYSFHQLLKQPNMKVSNYNLSYNMSRNILI